MKWDIYSKKELVKKYSNFSLILNQKDFTKNAKFNFFDEYDNNFCETILNEIINNV